MDMISFTFLNIIVISLVEKWRSLRASLSTKKNTRQGDMDEGGLFTENISLKKTTGKSRTLSTKN
jgi:hypothetical protein